MKYSFSHRLQLSVITAVLAIGCLLSAVAPSAHAQLGFDMYYATRTYVLTTPFDIQPTSNLVTNGPIDRVKLSGTGIINFLTVTNTGTSGGTLTATLYGSDDQTNLVSLPNYALISSTTTENITNFYWGGTNLTAANSVLLPGSITSPSASSGFNTPYLAPGSLVFTNTGAITLTGNKVVQVGIRLTDAKRYIYVVYTPGGTVTNFTVGALLTAVPIL